MDTVLFIGRLQYNGIHMCKKKLPQESSDTTAFPNGASLLIMTIYEGPGFYRVYDDKNAGLICANSFFNWTQALCEDEIQAKLYSRSD